MGSFQSTCGKFVVLALLLGASACATRKSTNSQSPSLHTNTDKVLAGDEEANVGEALLQSPSPSLAIKQFEKALQLDPNNAKANFYMAMIVPAQTLAELTNRSAELDERHDLRDLRRVQQGINRLNSSSRNTRALLPNLSLAGFSDFEALRLETKKRLLLELDTSIERMYRASRADNLVLNFKKTSLTASIDQTKDENQCAVTGQTIKCFTSVTGEAKRDHQVIVDSADFNVLSGSLKAIKNAVRMAIAYQVSGLSDLMEKVRDEQNDKGGISPLRFSEILANMNKATALGELDQADELDRITRSLSDALVNAESLATAEDLLCRNGARMSSAVNVFHSICMSMQTVKAIHSLLEGPTLIPLGVSKANGGLVTIKINVAAYLSKPIADIREFYNGSSKFNADGSMALIKDATIQGLFPDSDFLTKINSLGDKNIRDRSAKTAKAIAK